MNMGGTEKMLMTLLRMQPPWKSIFLSYDRAAGGFDQEIRRLGAEVMSLSHPRSFAAHYQLFRKVKPAAVHAHTLFQSGVPLAAAKAAGVPIRIVHAHTTADPSDKKGRKIYERLMRACITASATDFLACSQSAGNYLFAGKSFHIMPNLFNPEPFKRPSEAAIHELKQRHGWDDKLVIGSVGRLTKVKNHSFMLDILAALLQRGVNAGLLIVGDGDQLEILKQRAEEMSLTHAVTFTGAVEEPSIYYHMMDVFLMPSIFEGLGIAALEAQTSFTPVLGSQALQPEADLGGGLLHRLPLSEGSAIWAEKICELANQEYLPISRALTYWNQSDILEMYQELYQWKGDTSDKRAAHHII
ncbi:glycosyltransferase [Bacillus daqingensis]|uniref:Glycosyltransferase n=2 Tax=Bacillus daqingensis TaxID=872396 RepID=A0ABV9NSV0_9BACI